MSRAVDLFIVYELIKKLSTPFDKWEAYNTGVIDKDGNILKSPKERRNSLSDRKSFSKFDLLMLKIKRLLETIPGGKSKISNYGAALWLINEGNEENLTRKALIEYIELVENEELNILFEETMAVGAGEVEGIGFGPKGEPGIAKKTRDKYKKSKRVRRIPNLIQTGKV